MSNRVSFRKSETKCTVTIANESSDEICTTSYDIEVFDSDDDRWEHHASTTSEINPRSTVVKDYQKWSATDWKMNITSDYCEPLK